MQLWAYNGYNTVYFDTSLFAVEKNKFCFYLFNDVTRPPRLWLLLLLTEDLFNDTE